VVKVIGKKMVCAGASTPTLTHIPGWTYCRWLRSL